MFLINPNEFGRFITIAFNIFMVPMGFERKCSAPDGRLGATYINEYVVEVYNFYALAPETYIAKMIGWGVDGLGFLYPLSSTYSWCRGV